MIARASLRLSKLSNHLPSKRFFIFSLSSVVLYKSYRASEARRLTSLYQLAESHPPSRSQIIAEEAVKLTRQQSVTRFIKLSLRFLHLFIIFLPAIALSPMYLINSEKWIDILVSCIEKAGAVFIKVAQYVSHRRDMVGKELAEKFMHLRENAPKHSFNITNELFLQEFGISIEAAFQEFDQNPIASGSIAQVYKAKLNDKYLAIKVRHPNVYETIENDLSILYHVANSLAKVIPGLSWMELPVTINEVKKVLLDQTDLRFEAENLIHFNQRFKSFRQISFPKVIPGFTSPAILVETFEDAKPISYYIENKHELNQELARIGLQTFNRMLFFDNFIHADCHAGNIMVRIKKVNKGGDSYLWKFQDGVFNTIQQAFDTGLYAYERVLEKIYPSEESKFASSAKSLRLIKNKNYEEEVEMVLIDVGMVTVLNEEDRKNFLKLIKYVIYRDADRCMALMKELSQYKDEKMSEKVEMSFNFYMKQLFSELNKVPLHKINVGLVLQELLSIIRNHHMRLEGHFATLLTNLIVLEGLAKELDPEINIVGSTTPFLLNSSIEVLTS